MLIIISPAKTLDYETKATTVLATQPLFLDQSEYLIDELVTHSPSDIEKLMKISPKLAELNVSRFQQWSRPFNHNNAKQAVLAFKGDVYAGLNATSWDQQQLDYAQTHLRILSGLYGVLRPLDLMQAYRLEMGTKLSNPKGNNLYEFWGSLITDSINKQIQSIDSKILLNLASNEYFKSIKSDQINADIVTPVFRDWKNGQYKLISIFAKKARGLMSAWVIENQITELEQLSDFKVGGYQFSGRDSDALNQVFLRKQEN